MRLLLLSVAFLLCACGPNIRQILIRDTAAYTQCNYVEVECVDDACSNVKGGPWMATACGTRYRCTNTNGNTVCVPQ